MMCKWCTVLNWAVLKISKKKTRTSNVNVLEDETNENSNEFRLFFFKSKIKTNTQKCTSRKEKKGDFDTLALVSKIELGEGERWYRFFDKFMTLLSF